MQKWNDEIAATAQRWTDQCMFEHDTNRNKEDGTWVGQNMYFKGSSNKKDKNTVCWGHFLKYFLTCIFS